MMHQLQGYIVEITVRMPWPSGTSGIARLDLPLRPWQYGQENGSSRWLVVNFSPTGLSADGEEA
jgi:hypothetical protein